MTDSTAPGEGAHDPVTGLPCGEAFLRQCERAATECSHWERPFGVIALSIDEIDEHGFWNPIECGRLIAAASRFLRGRLRAEYFFAHVGGTFFIALPRTDEEHTAAMGRRLIENGLELDLDGVARTVAACAGAATVTTWDEPAKDLRAAIAASAGALRIAWRSGCNAFAMHSNPLERRARREARIGPRFRSALRNSEFMLLYQPIVDMDTGRLAAVEALVRWQHPEFGIVAPNEFVPLAERLGHAVALDHWVLDRAIREFLPMRAAMPTLKLHVNVSAVHFSIFGAAQPVLDVIREHGVPMADVVLEITESAAAGQLDAIHACVRELRDAGVRIAIDDLGSGFNSLEFFVNVPCDMVKVDRALMPQTQSDERRRAIVEGLIRLGARLGIAVVAEGVESDEQHEIVRGAGVRLAQGFRYGFPVLPERLPEQFPDGWIPLPG
jgi:EAL domain-containing protein (putative c-di-GMP-specific phosphodiesterase class I)/GGDEF domain-containing protein